MDAVAQAIADPIRRRILGILREGPRPAGSIADQFEVSRPAVSRHLRVLRESGLVRSEYSGRTRHYELDPEPLSEVSDWIDLISRPSAWGHRLDALDTEVHRSVRDRYRRKRDEEAA